MAHELVNYHLGVLFACLFGPRIHNYFWFFQAPVPGDSVFFVVEIGGPLGPVRLGQSQHRPSSHVALELSVAFLVLSQHSVFLSQRDESIVRFWFVFAFVNGS